jgi:hypothetical protein
MKRVGSASDIPAYGPGACKSYRRTAADREKRGQERLSCGPTGRASQELASSAPWSLAATGDFNEDGKADLVWRDTSGNTAVC